MMVNAPRRLRRRAEAGATARQASSFPCTRGRSPAVRGDQRGTRRSRSSVPPARTGPARPTRWRRRSRPARVGDQLELARRVAGGPQLDVSASCPASSLITVRSWCTPVRDVERAGSCGYFTWKYDENALDRDTRPPGTQRARAMPLRTSTSAPGPTSPNAPWHNEIAASNSRSNGRSRGVEAHERGRRAVGRALGSRCRRIVARCRSRRPRCPAPANAQGVTTRPAPDVEHALPGARPSTSTRNATSCSVPFVNE